MGDLAHTYMGKHTLTNLINLIPIAFEDPKLFWGFEDELKKLRQSLIAIADLVEDAEDKQQKMVDAGRWLRNLKEVAYEADDLLSELAYETTRIQIQNQEVHNFSSISRAIDNVKMAKFRLKMASKLKKVNQSLQNIQRKSVCLVISSIPYNFGHFMGRSILPTDPIRDNLVSGRRTDAAKIVNLFTRSCYEQLTVVSLIGIVGIGKTTLAKLVCQKVMALTKKPFHVKIWVSVSVKFSEHKVLREMLQSLNASMGGLTDEDAILRQLRKELVCKKFLMVLDNVRNIDLGRWDRFKALLSRICTKDGNAILVTTPSEEVASIMVTSSEHSVRPRFIFDDDCWFIMKERAFRNVITPVPSNLEAIGMEIAKICRGIPLIATLLGGIMSFNRDEQTWLKISKCDVFVNGRNLHHLPILKQNFHHLPSYLKPCIAFCSIFPKDFLIRKEELIWLWMAEGIVESCDTGNKCFDALLASSFFQGAETETDDYDDGILFKMNDFVHDLVLRLGISNLFISYNSYANETPSINHLYANDQYAPDLNVPNQDIRKMKRLRTIMVAGVPNQDIWKMKRLRSLHFNVADREVLSSSIGKMKHLRYLGVSISETKELPESITKLYNLQTLNLSNSSIKELPEFITNLFNLQTLDLSNCNINKLPESISKLQSLQTLNLSNSSIKDLPESISKLHNLQTLDVSHCNINELPESITDLCNLQTLKFLECKELTKFPRKNINNLLRLKNIAFSYEHQMPFGLGNLNGLETLPFFVVGPDWGGSIEELKCLNKLRGNLTITMLEEVGDKEEVERANLQGKAKIKGLGFEWSYGANDRSSRDEELLEGLQPHPNIERIKIKYYMGVKWPSWMLRMRSPGDDDSFAVISNLVDLRLERCDNCVQLPRLGDLPQLKSLKINHMGEVKCIGNEFYGIDRKSSHIGCLRLFPALKSLSISRMDNLIEWSSPSDGSNVVVFPCLENLSIQYCPKLTGFPMSDLSELVKLEIRDCEELRLLTGRKQSFAFLTSLSIARCSKLTYLRNWLQSDMNFKELSLRKCEWLTFIPDDLGKVSFLTSLEVFYCKRLRYFPEDILCKLTHLQNLSIGAFSEELDDFRYLNRIKDLPCLEQLEIWGSDFFGREMSFLPNQLQHLTVLRSLKIMGFTTMEELPEWLTNLQSLQSLSLDYCRHLAYPSTATVIRRLNSLTHLSINCCPVLEESKSEWLQSLDTTRIKSKDDTNFAFFNNIPDPKLFWGSDDELNKLRQSLIAIDDLVQDGEDVGRWLRYLKEDAYEADDLVSESTYETTRIRMIQNQKVHNFFTNLCNLQFLSLSSSIIEELPELITEFYILQTLNLSNTNLKELPRFIRKLQILGTLNISGSNIKKLPESISNLLHLRILDVSNSKIKKLPESIGKLHYLQTLDVSKSKIRKLPESIGKLHNLQTLNVSKSKIRKLPESVTNLYNLQTLKLVDCKELTELPRKKLRNLVNLKHIAFSYEHQMPSGIGKLYGLETLPLFVVSSDWGDSIQELEWLSKLRGKLEITRLEDVVDKQEADRANLQGKTDLRELGFYWSYGANNRTSSDEELLEGLRPNANIKRIKIKYYMGEKWPSWMLRMKNPRRIDSFPVLNNLVDLRLEGCWNCVQLPCLGDLASLQFLHISHMKRLKSIGNGFYGIDTKGKFSESEDLRLFPALKSLSLSWMENLTEWSSPSDGNRVVVFPCLQNLSIQSCAKLTGFPMTDLSGLANLEIKDCEEFRSIFEQQALPFLTSLSIKGCSKLTGLENIFAPDNAFRKVSVRRCEWLTFIPQALGKLRCLTSLEMYCCKRLRSFSEEILGNLTQLKNVKIGAFSKELDDFCYLKRIQELKHLEELEIWGSDFFGREMSSLPDEVQRLTGLKSLKIMGFTTMEALPNWIPYLQSLQSLSLNYCRHLECESTAKILPRLSSLTHLYIHCCPSLNKSMLESLLLLEGAEIKVEFSNV